MSVGECAAVQVRAYQEDFRRYYEDIKRYCERNKLATQHKTDESPEVATVEATAKSEEPDGGERDTPSISAPAGSFISFTSFFHPCIFCWNQEVGSFYSLLASLSYTANRNMVDPFSRNPL